MEIREKILIIEDEERIANFIKTILVSNGYEAVFALNGKRGIELTGIERPELIILDLGLPDIDGMEIIKQLREWSNVPILVVSARTHEKDKVDALGLGADDYITKPFGSQELLARVKVAIRHSRNPQNVRAEKFAVGDLVIDYDKHMVLVNGENVKLTQTEYKIVALLSNYAGKVLTYEYLIKNLWGVSTGNDNQILRVNMAHIRRKIEKDPAQPEYIFTEVGVGYWMKEPE